MRDYSAATENGLNRLPAGRSQSESEKTIEGDVWHKLHFMARSACTLVELRREMMQSRSLLLGVGIGLFGALAVLTARYIAVVLAG
jgi:hypothetical protein